MTSKTPSITLKEVKSWLKKRINQISHFFMTEDFLLYIVKTFSRSLTKSEKLILCLCCFALAIMPLAGIIINALGPNYDFSFPLCWLPLLPGFAIALFALLKIREHHPITGGILMNASLVILSIVAAFAGATSVAATPFMNHDLAHSLLRFDQWVGFNQTHWMSWVAHHARIHEILILAYGSIDQQVPILALLLIVIQCHKSLQKYLATVLITTLLAYLIYFILPSMPPAYVIHNPFFSLSSTHLIDRTYNLHHHLPYHLYPDAGLIAFPSCHILLALGSVFAITQAFFETKKKALRVILAIIAVAAYCMNALLVWSTMALGYHYLTDVIASFIIFISTWVAMKHLIR